MNLDEIRYSLENLKHRKLRSSLSILSILIGIASIFALLSFGLGIQNYIDEVGKEAGVNKLFVQARGVGAPGTDDAFFLTKDDLDVVQKVNGIDEVVGLYSSAGQIVYKEQDHFAFLTGVDVEKMDFIEETFSVDIYDGRSLKDSDKDKVLLGYNYLIPGKIFDKPVKVGSGVEINGKEFEVVGFYSEVGNPSDDANMYITQESYEALLPSKINKFAYIMASTTKNEEPSIVADRVEEKLRKFKDQEEGKEDFFVQTFEDALKTFSNVVNVLNGVLILIALISVVIATVNIMNTMYTAVLERTSEIGVMKSIGARNSSILSIFVFESGVLGFIGGLIGIMLGYTISYIGGNIAAEAGYALLQPIFPWYLILGCLGFATLVGILAGLLPAKQASRLRPVEALRYE